MHGGSIFAAKQQLAPLAWLGLTHEFWQVNWRTIVDTWIVLAILALLILIARRALYRANSLPQYLVLKFVNSFRQLIIQAVGHFELRYCAFITTLFAFILLCNLLALIPGLGEPTADLMTTFALALTSLGYAQWCGIKAHGLLGHLKNYFKPFAFMFPLTVIGHIAAILSLSFRLFGNISGGAMITQMWQHAIGGRWLIELAGLFSGLNLIIAGFFGVFEALIQAFVFAILSLTYLALEVQE